MRFIDVSRELWPPGAKYPENWLHRRLQPDGDETEASKGAIHRGPDELVSWLGQRQAQRGKWRLFSGEILRWTFLAPAWETEDSASWTPFSRPHDGLTILQNKACLAVEQHLERRSRFTSDS